MFQISDDFLVVGPAPVIIKRMAVGVLVALLPSLACAKMAPDSAPSAISQVTARSPIGTNLSAIHYMSTEVPFRDVFKSSSPWISGHGDVWDDGQPIDLNSSGWVKSLLPGQTVHTVFLEAGQHVPEGLFTVEYQGEGEIDYQEGARLIEHKPGRDLIEVDPSRGNSVLDIVSLDPRNPIRNIRILLPVKAPAGENYNPVFLKRIADFKSLRFMIWMLGDAPEQISQRTWSDRPKPGDARWTQRGVPVEVMVDLANRALADPWFSIPNEADDDYVRNFAEVVRARLRPHLKAYVEYSNEVWNSTYTVYSYAAERGLALGLSRDPDEARWRYHVRRSREIFDIFQEVLGSDRLVRVLATYAEDPALSEQMLASEDMASHVDALATAPYFGYELGLPESANRVRRMTLDEIFRELESVSLPATLQSAVAQAAVAERFRVPLIAYEGGQHMVGEDSVMDDAKINALFDAANRDSRMGGIYSRLLEEWSKISGGGLFLHLDDCEPMSRYGRWGSLEYIDQPREEAPKYDAMMRWMEEPPHDAGATASKIARADPVRNAEPDPLKTLAENRGIGFGAMYQYDLRGDAYDQLFETEMNVITAGTFMIDGDVSHRGRTEFDFSEMDEKVNFGLIRRMEIHGHILVWYNDIADWVKNSRLADVEGIMNDRIDAFVKRYAGKIKVWDVVNEAVNDVGSDGSDGPGGTLRLNHKWAKAMGAEYIRKAFVRAHAADPTAILRYNDYGMESEEAKFDGVKALLRNLKKQNAPVHALGWQMHVKPGDFDPATLLARMNEIADLGIDNYITELDVELPENAGAGDYEKQKQTYKTIVETFLAARRHKSIVVWGLRDGDPWWLTKNHPLLFDENHRRKPAYFGIREGLSGP